MMSQITLMFAIAVFSAALALLGTFVGTVLDRDGEKLTPSQKWALGIAAVAFLLGVSTALVRMNAASEAAREAKELKAVAEERRALAAGLLATELASLQRLVFLGAASVDARTDHLADSLEISHKSLESIATRQGAHFTPAVQGQIEEVLAHIKLCELMLRDMATTSYSRHKLPVQLYGTVESIRSLADSLNAIGSELQLEADDSPALSMLNIDVLDQRAPAMPRYEVLVTNHAHESLEMTAQAAIVVAMPGMPIDDASLYQNAASIAVDGLEPNERGMYELRGSGPFVVTVELPRSSLLHEYLAMEDLVLQTILEFNGHMVAKNAPFDESVFEHQVVMRLSRIDVPTP